MKTQWMDQPADQIWLKRNLVNLKTGQRHFPERSIERQRKQNVKEEMGNREAKMIGCDMS